MKILLNRLCVMIVTLMSVMLVRPATADIVTVSAVHDYVYKKWGIEIPYNPTKANNIPTMTYLMQVVDITNAEINGWETTAYAKDAAYTTSNMVGINAARNAVDRLIEKVKWHFFFTPETTSLSYSFQISAAGNFYIDWGDGQKQTIRKRTVDTQTISHKYATPANTHEIKLGGYATNYNVSTTLAAISFSASTARLAAIRGCLGCVFSTLSDGRQPRFYEIFKNNTNLSSDIPSDLFNGISGAPVSNMFYFAFYGCKNLSGQIPEKLFAEINGPPTEDLFRGMFFQCGKLSGGIPENLFAGIKGEPAPGVFRTVFNGCSGLTGSIPEKLFSGISGTPADNMFNGTFMDCKALTGNIAENLFDGIRGAPADGMFYNTFSGCSGLSGSFPERLFNGVFAIGEYKTDMFHTTFSKCNGLSGTSAKIGDKYLYEIWPDAVSQTYSGVTNLFDRECVPTNWGGLGTKPFGTCDGATAVSNPTNH